MVGLSHCWYATVFLEFRYVDGICVEFTKKMMQKLVVNGRVETVMEERGRAEQCNIKIPDK